MSNERRFDPKNLDKLEAPEREQRLPVGTVMDAAGVSSMLNVADIGAGSGYFTLPMAQRVAPGKVYAVEPSAKMLAVLRDKLATNGAPGNIEVVTGEDSATGLPEASCDLIFLSYVWHEIDDHAAALREFSRIATPNAKLAIVEVIPDAPNLPNPPIEHRIARADVERSLEDGGWGVLKSDAINLWTYIVVGQR